MTGTILRPLTPPLAFSALIRALNPSSAFSNVDPASAALRVDVADLDLLGGHAGGVTAVWAPPTRCDQPRCDQRRDGGRRRRAPGGPLDRRSPGRAGSLVVCACALPPGRCMARRSTGRLGTPPPILARSARQGSPQDANNGGDDGARDAPEPGTPGNSGGSRCRCGSSGPVSQLLSERGLDDVTVDQIARRGRHLDAHVLPLLPEPPRYRSPRCRCASRGGCVAALLARPAGESLLDGFHAWFREMDRARPLVTDRPPRGRDAGALERDRARRTRAHPVGEPRDERP